MALATAKNTTRARTPAASSNQPSEDERRRARRTSAKLGRAVLALTLMALGCDGDPRPNRLDVADALPAAESDDEWLRKQQLLRVKVENLDANGNVVSTSEEDKTVAGAAGFVRQSCYEWVGNFCPLPRNCEAKTLLALATPQSDPITITAVNEQGVSQRYTFDRVTEANAAEFASLAVDQAQAGVQSGLQRLKQRPAPCRGANGVGWGIHDSRNWAQIYATHVVEAYYLARAAYDRAFEATMNVADSARSSSASATIAGKRVAVLPLFSRAAAAHLIVGGDDGLLGSTTSGYCVTSLAPSERKALAILRDAAPRPSAVLDQNLSIQDFLQKVGQNGESVRERLASLYEVKQFGWQGALPYGTASQKVEEYYALAEQDFVAAREYLKQELTTFNRSQTATLPAVRGIARYAGVAGDRVPELPSAAWTARARFTAGASPWYDVVGSWRMAVNGYDPHLVENRRTPPLDMFIAETHSRIRELTRTATTGAYSANPPVSSTDQAEVLGVLNSIELGKEYLGAIELIVPADRASVRGVVHGFALTDKVRVVVGEDGLRCAVQGSIEGSDCRDTLAGAKYATTEAACTTKPGSLSCLTLSIPTTVSPAGSAYFGTNGYIDGSRVLSTAVVNALIDSKTRLYFVRLKAQGLLEEPGNYQSLGGSTIGAPPSSGRWNVAFPVVATVDERVAQALAPNRKNCVENEVTCLGVSTDARLPLEDELTDDGNGFENSWRHYLSLARQASDEAALLGREFRDAKLNKLQGAALTEQRREDQRQAASNALQEVQNICGTALDTNKLLDFLSKAAPAAGERNNLSSVLAPGSCPVSGGNCVIDLPSLTTGQVAGTELDAAELKRFQACIDDSPASIEPYVTLGDRQFCVWSRGNDVCPVGAPCFRDPPCTDLASSTKGIAKPLNYFVGAKAPADRTPGKACELLRKARGTPSNQTLSELAATGVLNQDRLKDRLGQLGFRAEYGGFFSILEDKTPRLTSGHPTRGLTSGWPWSGKALGCESGGAGLFCTELTPVTTVPATDEAIGAFNSRVFRAALAAAGTLGENLYVIRPRGGKTDPVPCTAERETEYHTHSARGALGTTIPVWTCDPQFDSAYRYGDELVFQPRNVVPPMAWLLPSGSSRSGTFYVAGANLGPYPRDGAMRNTWAGLSNAGMFLSLSGLVVDSLRTGGSVAGDVMFTQSGDLDLHLLAVLEGRSGEVGSMKLDVAAVLDGLELLCELDAKHDTGSVQPGGTLDLSSVDAAADAIRKLADALNQQGSNIFFANVPKLAVDALGVAGPTGAFPALSAEMGEAVAGLRQAFIGTQHALPVMANALRSLSTEFQSLRTQLEISRARKELVNYDTLSAVLNQVTACAQSASSPAQNFISAGAATLITCTNSAAQIGIAFKQGSLQTGILDAEEQLARLAFIDRMSENATALERAALGLAESREQVTMYLTRIDGLKKRAKVAIARAIYLDSYQSEAQVAYDNAVGALESVAQKRFNQALMNAKLMSFFAKRAIEQRLGVRLHELRQDFPLVEAPALWEAEACSNGGFLDDDANGEASGDRDDWVARYGNGFIGDYVTKLENFVESYRLSESFHEGKDTAVISLRDDIANVRAECAQRSRNLLANAAELHGQPWVARTCNPVDIGGIPVTGVNCISAVARHVSGIPDLAVTGFAGYQDSAAGYQLRFGDGKNCSVTDSGGCGWKPGSALGQVVSLSAGLYRLSWYTRDDKNASYTNGAKTEVVILRPTGQLPAPTAGAFVNPADGSGTNWKRSSKEFSIAVEGEYEVGFGVPAGDRPLETQPVTIGAPMLELIKPGNAIGLGTFEATNAEGYATIPLCEDSDGALFRLKRWTRECVRLCNDGFSGSCEDGPQHCYREFHFRVSQAALQSGRILNYSGFAKGNFNYRIDSLGVNFVGSNIRNCEDAALPSTCYNAGFVPYSLEHNGPFSVRNRAGADVPALLFDARIEHARGLALERYFTSPISSTDRELMTDYVRTEFSGRPLDGNFSLRIWEDQGLDFSSLQDVQLILNYRYWTAFD